MGVVETPLVQELRPAPSVTAALERVRHWPRVLLLDSPRLQIGRGRYSFLTADPRQNWHLSSPTFGVDPLSEIAAWKFPTTQFLEQLPPFQGGLAGLLGYEIGRAWERVPAAAIDEFQVPAMVVGLYDWVIAWDHLLGTCHLIVQPWSADGRASATADEQRQRADQVLAALQSPETRQPGEPNVGSRGTLPRESLAAEHPVAIGGLALDVRSSFSRTGYLAAVQRVVDYIRAGDAFQVNLTQRLLTPARGTPTEIYCSLRETNPAPFAAYFDFDEGVILSASPERFVQVTGRHVETRPIKGTRARAGSGQVDLLVGDALRESQKDRAENIMIVDLLRNDLSRVCQPGSVQVPQLCRVETYQTVKHLVSVVQGELCDDHSVWDLIRATLPGGSISGAPKVRAMEIIAELEPTVRGPYTGNLFYAGVGQRFDSSILIRTLVWSRGWLSCGIGGGLVGLSDPADEYAETLVKGAAMMTAVAKVRP